MENEKIAMYRKLRDENLRTIDIYLSRIEEVKKLIESEPRLEEKYRQRRRIKTLYSSVNELRYVVAEIENLLYAWGDDEIVCKKRASPVRIVRYVESGKQSHRNRIPAGAINPSLCEPETRRIRKNGIFELLAGRSQPDDVE